MTDAAHDFQLDQFVSHQTQRPALGPLWFGATEQRHQCGFRFSIHFAFLRTRRLQSPIQRRVEALFSIEPSNTFL
jgi:hypothetical protein